MRFFKRKPGIPEFVKAVNETIADNMEILAAKEDSNTGLLVLHLTTINSQILHLKGELDKIALSQKAIVGQVGATQAAQAALLSAFAGLLRRRPDIQNPPEERPANPMDDIF
jgi:hypothetical protein